MRITRDIVLKLARDSAARQLRQNKDLICIYLTGSVLLEDYLLGGATDIDLVCIHNNQPPAPREVVPLVDEVHLDIAHLSEAVFQQPRQLRTDPWLGTFMCVDPIALHDTHHWFEFTQARICAQFDRPEYVIQRSRPMAEEARQIWMDLNNGQYEPGSVKVMAYLKALERAGNAIATLSGPPLTERRFWLSFSKRTQAVNRQGLYGGLVDLFTTNKINPEIIQSWVSPWSKTLKSITELSECPPQLMDCRKTYYERAINALVDDHPEGAIWILLRTFTKAINLLGEQSPFWQDWHETCLLLELDEDHFASRLNSLDAYLDSVEETIELWSKQFGVFE
jgi:hypothetical protein